MSKQPAPTVTAPTVTAPTVTGSQETPSKLKNAAAKPDPITRAIAARKKGYKKSPKEFLFTGCREFIRRRHKLSNAPCGGKTDIGKFFYGHASDLYASLLAESGENTNVIYAYGKMLERNLHPLEHNVVGPLHENKGSHYDNQSDSDGVGPLIAYERESSHYDSQADSEFDTY